MKPGTIPIEDALRTLTAAGGFFSISGTETGSLSLAHVAERLDVSVGWVRAHLDEFPRAWRLPAASSGLGQPTGELRIPVRDLEAFEARRRLKA